MKRHFLIMAIGLVIIIGIFFFLAIKSSQHSMMELLKEEARGLISIVALAQTNSIFAEARIEDQIIDGLVNIIHSLYKLGFNQGNLSLFYKNFNLNSIFVYDTKRNRIVSICGHPFEISMEGVGDKEKMSFQYFNWRNEKYIRFIQRIDNYLVQIELSAESVTRFSQEFGISKILNEIIANKAIRYLVLQDLKGIIFATPGVKQLTRIEADSALLNVLENKMETVRMVKFENRDILEIAQPFIVEGQTLGVFRIAMNLDNYNAHIRATYLELLLIFLLLVGMILVLLFFSMRYERTLYLQELFSSVLGAVEEGIILLGRGGKITGVNRMFCEIFGLAPETILNRRYNELFSDDLLSLKNVLKSGVVVDEKKEVQKRVLHYTTYPLFDQKKNITGAISIIRDITKIQKMEEEEEERERIQFLGNLVANFAHEIKNPLNGLSIAAQRLRAEFSIENPEWGMLVSTIIKEIESLNRVVNDFLGLVKPRVKEKSVLNLGMLIREALALIQEQARNKDIKVNTKIAEDIELTAVADDLKRAIFNILLNAVESVSKGAGIIDVILKKIKGGIVIEINDNGSGMTKEVQERIFEPYFTTKTGGTGLGLYIAQRIIKENGGMIKVRSAPQRGTKFRIILPLV